MSEPSPEQERGPRRVYANETIEVHWEPKLCIHTRALHRGPARGLRPGRAPVGAARGSRRGPRRRGRPTAARPARSTTAGSTAGRRRSRRRSCRVVPRPNGPLFLRGRIRIESVRTARLIREDTRVALCRCGGSQNKPFCDGSAPDGSASGPTPDREASLTSLRRTCSLPAYAYAVITQEVTDVPRPPARPARRRPPTGRRALPRGGGARLRSAATAHRLASSLRCLADRLDRRPLAARTA